MFRFFILLVMVLLLVTGWLFSAANSSDLTVNYLLGSYSTRTAWWLLAIFLFGFVVGIIYCGYGLLQARLANRKLRERCAQQELELQKLTAQLTRQTGR